jgi:hypothetical protein
MIVMIVSVVMAMVVMILVVAAMPQHQGRSQVHDEPDARHPQSRHEVDRRRGDQPHDGFDHHRDRDHAEQERAGESPQHLDLPRAESEAFVAGPAPREPIRNSRDGKRHHVGGHVPPVGQQRHGAGEETGDDLRHHRRGGDRDHQPRAPLGAAIAGVVRVAVLPAAQVMDRHDLF